MKKKALVLTTALLSAVAAATAFGADAVPLRSVVEDAGGQVQYHKEDKSVDVSYFGTQMHFVLGSNTITVNGGEMKANTYLTEGKAMMDAEVLNKIMKGAKAVESPQEVKLGIGKVMVYDFGGIKLHAYISQDALYDVSYLVEKGDSVVLIEAGAFKANNQEWKGYIASLGKTVAGQLMAYHPNGAHEGCDAPIYATAHAVESWGSSIKALTDSFAAAFGEGVAEEMPLQTESLKVDQTITLGGIDFRIMEAGDDAYSIEIPEINCIYRHMMGSKCHNILPSTAMMDGEIATLQGYADKGYTLILTSHYDPEGQAAVAEKIAYLEKTKALAESCDSAEAFIAAMKQAFPNYSGENYLEMTAGMLFGA
ncbi:stalk domain-containing protein [Anaerotignum sp.]